MVFSSLSFLFAFLPITLIFYTIAPRKLKNAVLLLASLAFYYWGEQKNTLLLIISILLSYVLSIFIEKTRGKRICKFLLFAAVGVNVLLLGYFKYADFFISSVNSVFSTNISLLKIALPIGISFYTFQSISYIVDVYRGDVPAQRNVVKLGAYISMFPQLVAGPIVRYRDIEEKLTERSHSLDGISDGIRRFVLGMGKKVLLSNNLGALCSIFQSSNDKSVGFFWLYAISYTLQIYFDFSGYSDMAIGLGKMFGFDFCENFNFPYISKSITEFWRRWHISLGSWFRDYVYIPMGGNRVKKWRWFFNILTVWLLTGLWHGASWNFVIWGLYFGIFLIIEKLFLLEKLKKSKILSHIYVIIIIIFGFVIFNAETMSEAMTYMKAMVGLGGYKAVSAEFIYYLKSYAVILIISTVTSTPFVKNIIEKLRKKKGMDSFINLMEPVVLLVITVVSVGYLVDNSFNPFLYFRF